MWYQSDKMGGCKRESGIEDKYETDRENILVLGEERTEGGLVWEESSDKIGARYKNKIHQPNQHNLLSLSSNLCGALHKVGANGGALHQGGGKVKKKPTKCISHPYWRKPAVGERLIA